MNTLGLGMNTLGLEMNTLGLGMSLLFLALLPDTKGLQCINSGEPCLNGGRCLTNSNKTDSCLCRPGFWGSLCQFWDPCSGGIPRCVNGGTCVPVQQRGNESVSHTCICTPGRTGPRCELEDACLSRPCHEDAVCITHPLTGLPVCTCQAGFSGADCREDLNECEMGLNPCEHGGVCVNTAGSFQCQCQRGYGGTRCHSDINECQSQPCQHQGTCMDKTGGYLCICEPGYTGLQCEEERDPCDSAPCANQGDCRRVDRLYYKCVCQPGSTGPRCEELLDRCVLNPCLNGGSCVEGEGGLKCACQGGYTGPHCEHRLDSCKLSAEHTIVCLNGGRCVDSPTSPRCLCPEGFGGSVCQDPVDPCERGPCLNEGVCTPQGKTGYTCQCAAGFTGSNCSSAVDECLSQPCQNGGSCVDRINSFQCVCPEGTSGSLCEVDHDDCDPLTSEPLCFHGGVCVDRVGGHDCLCPTGFVGSRCEGDVNECLSNPCVQPGTLSCVPGVNQYHCLCRTGYTGQHCESVIDSCQSAPCQNGGACTVEPGTPLGYNCQCTQGFSGSDCSTSLLQPPSPCLSQPCRSGGTCVPVRGSPFAFRCLCTPKYSGAHCESNREGEGAHTHLSPLTSDPWTLCPPGLGCPRKFRDGRCDAECAGAECLRDGFDCLTDSAACDPRYVQYCRDHYGNGHCESGCRSGPCGWDGVDCFGGAPRGVEGSLVLLTPLSVGEVLKGNLSLLWGLSAVLRTGVRMMGTPRPSDPRRDLRDLRDLHDLPGSGPGQEEDDVTGSLVLIQVDNRPCSLVPDSCFHMAEQAAHFLSAVMSQGGGILPELPFPLTAVQGVGGMGEGEAEEDEDPPLSDPPSLWLWVAIGMAAALGLTVAAIVIGVKVIAPRRRGGELPVVRSQHRQGGAVHDRDHQGAVWNSSSSTGLTRSKKQNGKKQGKNSGRKRREPLGEDAIGLRPLRHSPDYGEEVDITHSSLEEGPQGDRTLHPEEDDDGIRDHRPLGQKHFQGTYDIPQSPGGQDGGLRSALHGAASEFNCSSDWTSSRTALCQASELCSADCEGVTALITATRLCAESRVRELLQRGAEVNRTDHRGRSALHWSSVVNNPSAARTLLQHGAAIDLQDCKGETPLFLAAREGSYDTARLLLQGGANQELPDHRGWLPRHMAQERSHYDIIRLLLAAAGGQGPPIKKPPCHQGTTNGLQNKMAATGGGGNFLYNFGWQEPYNYPQSSCGAEYGRPYNIHGRSASFSGVIGHHQSFAHPGARIHSREEWAALRSGRLSPQHWAQPHSQSVTALVSPRIHGKSSRPIDTLQEVTSEAEEETGSSASPGGRQAQNQKQEETPHFLYSHEQMRPTGRQRSFSCNQNALRRYNVTPGHPLDQSAGSTPSPASPVTVANGNAEARCLSPSPASSDQWGKSSSKKGESNSQSDCKVEVEGSNCAGGKIARTEQAHIAN
ncbi:neurogenic locus notch homolog protein 1-like isoform X2 [Acipenser ruthenus]|uniref:neurogenic locus notch homolog protein 1-like isoform X2 n=1 Tax=Acipenser ruthenus TaxID=7906 RepID=UPI002741FE5F|nr:neurogenic locus notch homolog protein 1-like isoform X2 [Acipenser ruthenus]